MEPHSNISSLSELDDFVLSARSSFRSQAINKQKELERVFNLLFRLLRSIGKYKSLGTWEDSREEYVIKTLLKANQVILGMYYLSESGFYDLALSLRRNFTELILVAVAIGCDYKSFVDWRNDRNNLQDVHKIAERIKKSASVPDGAKQILPPLLKYWNESSQLHSHQIKKKSIEEGIKIQGGDVSLGSHIATENFQEKRLNTLRNMWLNIIMVLLGVFKYSQISTAPEHKDRFPEAQELIEEYMEFQKDPLKSEPTA